jgi:hypothetical protein
MIPMNFVLGAGLTITAIHVQSLKIQKKLRHVNHIFNSVGISKAYALGTEAGSKAKKKPLDNISTSGIIQPCVCLTAKYAKNIRSNPGRKNGDLHVNHPCRSVSRNVEHHPDDGMQPPQLERCW